MATKSPKAEIVTVRLDARQRKRLDALAAATERSNSFLAAEAIETFLDLQEWQVRGVREAMKSVAAGHTFPHSTALAMLSKARGKA